MNQLNETQFNLSQLATWEEAREYAKRLSEGSIVIGGGVLPESKDPNVSGIYSPLWLPGPAGFPEPHYVDEKTGKEYFFLHFRFRNGAEGMNVGLIIQQFRRYPNSPYYVLKQLSQEAEMLADNSRALY